MSRTARIIIALIVVALIGLLGLLVYIWVSGGSAAPSAPLSAPTLAIGTPLPTSIPVPTDEAKATVTAEASASVQIAATAEVSATLAASGSAAQLVVMNIVPDQSDVHFITHEVLRGSPNTVDGCTREVAGQIGVDFANPQNSEVGEIKIDARSFSTDNELRNRAIRGQILQSSEDQFEFISFKPTSLSGLPTSLTVGQAFEFHITGDLTIRDITQPVTFDVTATPNSQTQISGTATATVQRDDFNLIIPSAPGVADVDEAVVLKIDFVAMTGEAQQATSSSCST